MGKEQPNSLSEVARSKDGEQAKRPVESRVESLVQRLDPLILWTSMWGSGSLGELGDRDIEER